jgi:hypothetical protein
MITTPTVFILGAGASRPYGFPLASELHAEMLSLLRGKEFLTQEYMGKFAFSEGDSKLLEDLISKGGFISIDQLLSRQMDITKRGAINLSKVLLVRIIAGWEWLQRRHEEKIDRNGRIIPEDDWYNLVFNQAVGSQWGDFIDSDIDFITFNYDRSLEYFLYRHLVGQLSAPEHEVVKLLDQKILHMHGSLGALTMLEDYGKTDVSGKFDLSRSNELKFVFEDSDVKRRPEISLIEKRKWSF